MDEHSEVCISVDSSCVASSNGSSDLNCPNVSFEVGFFLNQSKNADSSIWLPLSHKFEIPGGHGSM